MKNSADQGGCYSPRPRWITLSEICRILHILRKPNSIIALLYIQNDFPVLKGTSPFRSLLFCSPKITQLRPQAFSVNGSIICSGLNFWRHLMSSIMITCSALLFWRPTVINSSWLWWTYACGFNQSETRKYLEWIIMPLIHPVVIFENSFKYYPIVA